MQQRSKSLLAVVIRLLLILQGGSLYLSAQDPVARVAFYSIAREDDQALARVSAVCHDKKGFIWIGTYAGLIRHDGYHFIDFRADPGAPGSLSTDLITAILEDKWGNFWVGTDRGLFWMDRSGRQFFPVFAHRIGHVLVLKEDKDGNLWVGTTAGLCRISSAGDPVFSSRTLDQARLTYFEHSPENSATICHNHVWSLKPTPSGHMWVGTGNGVNYLDPGSGIFDRAPFGDGPHARTFPGWQSTLWKPMRRAFSGREPQTDCSGPLPACPTWKCFGLGIWD